MITINKYCIALLVIATTSLAGCIAVSPDQDVVKRTDNTLDIVSKEVNKPKYIVSDKPYVDASPVYRVSNNYEWLKNINGIEIFEASNSKGVPLSEVIKQFKAANVNVASSLPLNRYNYKGFSINSTNALTALEIITSSMELDFIIRSDTGSKYVEIIPLRTSSFTLNVPDRQINFSITENSFSGETDLRQLLSGGGQQGSQGGQQSGQQGEGGEGGEGGQRTSTTIKADFWKSLNSELQKLMTRFIPTKSKDVESSNSQFANNINIGGSLTDLFTPVVVGNIVTNSNTGHITIQAPSHIREEVLDYLSDINSALNTSIKLNGKIVIVTETEDSKKGFDISSFIEFGEDYGLVMQNNAFNQITISKPDEINDYFSTAVDGAFGNALGLVADDGLLQVFNAYVDQNSNIQTVYDPKISGTSGSVATYSRVTPFIFTNFQSGSTTNESSTTESTQNNLIPIDFGITINAYPVYNASEDLIRTHIDLVQVFQASVQVVSQSINGELIQTSIPIPDKVTIKTEVIGKNGALIIVGGQDVITYEGALQGIPNLKDSYLGGLFGTSSKKSQRSKYYFVFEAKAVDPRTSI